MLWLLCLHRLGRLLFFSGVAAGSQVSLPLCGNVLELAPAEASGHLLPNLGGAPVAACRGFFLERQNICKDLALAGVTLMTLDMLKSVALIATFIGVLIIFAMWVSLWENVWQASVEPTRGAIYDTRLNRLAPSHCLSHSWSWWWTEGCKLT